MVVVAAAVIIATTGREFRDRATTTTHLAFNIFSFLIDNFDHIFCKFGNPFRCWFIRMILYRIIINKIYIIPKISHVGIVILTGGGGGFGRSSRGAIESIRNSP